MSTDPYSVNPFTQDIGVTKPRLARPASRVKGETSRERAVRLALAKEHGAWLSEGDYLWLRTYNRICHRQSAQRTAALTRGGVAMAYGFLSGRH